MIKISKAIHTAAALAAAALLAAGCSRDDLEPLPRPDSGLVKLEFRACVPEPEVQSFGTRAVDPDGGGVRDMTLFCFDNFGLFVSTVSADVASPGAMEGKFTAEVPTHTRRIHFVANQNMTDFRESSFINKSESEVMALLEGSAGHMIYWARFACAPLADPTATNIPAIDDELEQWLAAHGNKITMLRNHALVTVANPTIDDTGGQQGNGQIEITGMAACNIQAFGTVAPYDPQKGFDFTLEEWRAGAYVTIPQRDAKQSDILDVTANTSQYIFEHRNSTDDPVSIILRGHKRGQTANDDLYYRVMLVDAKGDFIPVRRNHRYTLNIQGALSFGQPTFEAALTAAATNNVWVSISDNVNEVEDNQYVLHVDETFVLHNESDFTVNKSIVLGYSVKSKKSGLEITPADKPEVMWLDNAVAAQEFRHDEFNIDAAKTEGVGTIVVAPRALGSNQRLEGTLLVKHGRLQRKIKIVVIKEQTFAPSWISTGIYGGADVSVVKSRPHVTLMFTVPESCPAELFPMNVYITASGLDIRNASGMSLPVVRAGDTQWYSSDDGPEDADYKFVLPVEGPGPQRVYFENILTPQQGAGPGAVYIEAPHFATVRRLYTFANTMNAITVENTGTYSAADIAQGAADEFVYYYRVAQKAGAPVHFDMLLHKKTEDKPIDVKPEDRINAQTNDEFLFYSTNLTNYNADEAEIEIFDCYFSRFNDRAAAWQRKQNPNGGRMLMFMPKDPENPRLGTGKYVLYMYTNCARSAEVVRISSNLNDQPSVLNFDAAAQDGPGYTGTVYRSFVFELVNHTPFRFGARVRCDNGDWIGGADEPDRDYTDPQADVPEKVTELTWTFEPNKRVDIAIDVTSFPGLADTKNEDADAARVSVDPFGREFEIYIDAPMLQIDGSRLADFKLDGDKLKADPDVPGRFIYTVAADREAERAFGVTDALNTDVAAAAGAQARERKILPFLIGSVASAGDIVISSNKQQIVFYDKTFRVTNESIKGRIVYEVENPDGSTTQTPVPDDLFVAFERVTNSNRIGSVTMTGEGEFELRLRKEYPLQWSGYAVAFHFEHNGHLHHAQYATLADMYEAIIKNGEPVVLKREAVR